MDITARQGRLLGSHRRRPPAALWMGVVAMRSLSENGTPPGTLTTNQTEGDA